MLRRTLLLLICLACFSARAQEGEHEESHESEHFRPHHIGLTLGHSHISQGVVEEGRRFQTLPSWELAYSYSFNERWFLGVAVHLILEDFEVERIGRSDGDEDEIILREKPIAPSVVAGYRATKHSSFALGVGAEFASGETFLMTHFSYEWSTHINDKWEFVVPLTYDMRWNAYDIWTLSVGVVRMF